MRLTFTTKRFALVLLSAAALTVSLSTGTPSLSASDKKGDLHAVKECSQYNRLPGGFCTFTSSDFAPITAGTKIYYDQAPNVPVGLIDSNVVLDAGSGNRALGRCTIELATQTGLCTFSDGTGQFAGFQARINVSYLGGPTYRWDGTFNIDHDSNRK